LAVISALADRAEFESAPDGGTVVRMAFVGRDLELSTPVATGPGLAERLELRGDVIVRLSPVGLLPGVLGRLTRAAAAGAHFSLDRFSALDLIADELSSPAGASAHADASIGFALVTDAGHLGLTIGPFEPGSGERLRERPGSGTGAFPLTRLVDELTIEPHAA